MKQNTYAKTRVFRRGGKQLFTSARAVGHIVPVGYAVEQTFGRRTLCKNDIILKRFASTNWTINQQ